GGVFGEVAAKGFEGLAAGGDVVLGQGARVGAGVGDDLVALVEGLGDLAGAAGGQADAAVGLAPGGGEVVEARAGLGGGFFLFADGGVRTALAGGEHGFGEGFFPDAVDAVVFLGGVLFVVGALIHAFVGALGDVEGGGDAPVVAGLEVADLEFAVEDDGERGGLHAADGGDVAGAGAEHALG